MYVHDSPVFPANVSKFITITRVNQLWTDNLKRRTEKHSKEYQKETKKMNRASYQITGYIPYIQRKQVYTIIRDTHRIGAIYIWWTLDINYTITVLESQGLQKVIETQLTTFEPMTLRRHKQTRNQKRLKIYQFHSYLVPNHHHVHSFMLCMMASFFKVNNRGLNKSLLLGLESTNFLIRLNKYTAWLYQNLFFSRPVS